MRSFVLCVLPLLGSCATARIMPPAIPNTDFLDGQTSIVTQPYRYSVGRSGIVIEIPQGFVTDYASVPSMLWNILGPHGRYSRATVIHDSLYWSQTCTRDQADNLLMIAMKELGVRRRDRWIVYGGVRIGGEGPWNANARERAAGRPKFVPADRYALADDHSWTEARAILERDGVRDPPLPTSAAYCALGNSTDVP